MRGGVEGLSEGQGAVVPVGEGVRLSTVAPPGPRRTATPQKPRRGFWLKQLHQWHWVSSALCLVGMLLFAATGITLNHAAEIEAQPVVSERQATLPRSLLRSLPKSAEGVVPAPVAAWIDDALSVDVAGRSAEWSDDEIYVALPRLGGDAWVSIDRANGEVIYEMTDRGWISYLNDLHKGRNAGAVWRLFIDLFAVACFIFCITGLLLLNLHARHRPMTWPTVGLGLVIPALLALFFIHL